MKKIINWLLNIRLTLKVHYTAFIFLLILFGLNISTVHAQKRCGTSIAVEKLLEKHPQLIKRYEKIKNTPASTANIQGIAKGTPMVTIPVVVHIVLQDPQEVTDAQVQSQIDVLNQDYQLLNQDADDIPTVWKAIAGDMKIKFCLAKRTPDNLPTNGIERTKTNKTSFNDVFDAVKSVKHKNMGGANAWDSHEYLNIWICNLAGEYLGIGTPPATYPDNEQGVVVHYKAFGTIGNLYPKFNKGRSCTHEVGHYFNLLHLWGSSDRNIGCKDDDHVHDTPKQYEPVYGTPSFPTLDPCSTTFPGIMIDNFMGYANDDQMNMFTAGQAARAKFALFNYRPDLLTSQGCVPVHLEDLDARIKSVSNPQGKICNAETTPVVTLQNMGIQTLTKVDIKYRVDNHSYQTFHWTGHLTSLDSIKIPLPNVSTPEGFHQFKIYSTQPNGSADEQPDNDTLTTTFHLDPDITGPYSEGFESTTFPPKGWTINNPDHKLTWEKTNKAAYSGNHAIVMKNLAYQANGPIDEITSPVFDIKNKDSAFLFFEVAAAVQSDLNGNNKLWDTLEILVSFDCGRTGTSVYKKAGADLITTGANSRYLYEFIPNRKNQWRRDSIDLTPFLNKGKFRIIFRNITNWENNIYLDDIQIKTKDINPILIEKKILVVPNPFTNRIKVAFLEPPTNLKSVIIYNILGQRVAQKSASAINSRNRINFHLKNLQAGVYFVNLIFKDKKIIKKMIKVP